jgi:PAS domain S-box-containing protein
MSERTTVPDAGSRAPENGAQAREVENESLYRRQLEAVCNNATVALFIMDGRQHCAYMNPAAERLTGYRLEEVRGRPLHDYVHHTRPDGTPYPLEECPIDRALPENNQEQGEEIFVHKDGSFYPVAFTASPIREDGRSVGTIIEVRNLTEEKRAAEGRARAEAQLRASEARLSATLEQLPLGIGVMGLDGHWVLNNALMRAFMPETIPSRDPERGARWRAFDAGGGLVPPHEWPGARALRGQTVSPGMEMIYTADDGREIWTRVSAAPFRDAAGEIVGAVCAVEDISERKAAEAKTREAEERLRLLTDNARDYAIIFLDAERRVTGWNVGAERILGWAEGEALGRPDEIIFTPEDRARGVPEEEAERARRDGRAENERWHVRRDGSRFFASGEMLALYDEAGSLRGFAKLFRDLTERRRAEERLRESEERYRTLFESIDEGFVIVEMIFDENSRPVDYRFVQANPAFTRLTGLPEDAVGRTARELVPDLEEFWFETYGRVALTGEAVRFENKSEPMGRWFDVYASRAGGADSRRVAIVFNNITERMLAQEDRDRLLEREQWARLAAEEARAAAEAARLEAEEAYRREQEARLQAEESNRLKDEFLATVSHELRTPLTAVLGWADLLTGDKLDEGTRALALDVIQRNARAQNQLVGDLLDVSRIITGKLHIETRRVDLVRVVGAALDVVRPAADAKGISLVADFGPGPFDLTGDPDRLQQVVWNLLSNAVKFTPAGGSVGARLWRAEGQALVSITDTGQGIPAEFLPYVFDRFRQQDGSTTRRHGGLGLGLSIVRHLVELHGGEVAAESAGEGRGSTFTVRLPLRAAETAAEGADADSAAGPRRVGAQSSAPLAGLRVLIVDDDTAALAMLRATFEHGGAAVESVTSAAAALEAFARAAPDLLISDIGMPGEDGYALIAAVRSLPPARGGRVPALALTAYAGPQDRERALASGFQAHVAKPVEPADLIAAVAGLVRQK